MSSLFHRFGQALAKALATALAPIACALLFALPLVARAEPPTQLKIAAILVAGPDDPWNATFLDAWRTLRKQKPHGLEINEPTFIENVWGDPAEAALRLYARKGYDIVWAHSSFSDQVKRIRKLYPNTLFVLAGDPNEAIGGNALLVFNRIYEPAYLAGIAAGGMSKTGVVGVVGSFPSDDVNDAVNAFFAGARSVNPKIKRKVTFINSWYDPPLALEAAKAQIAAGVDQMFTIANTFEACKEKNITCYGAFKDWNGVAPKQVAGSVAGNWAPVMSWAIDQWYDAKVKGGAVEGNLDKHFVGFANGGSAFIPAKGFDWPSPVAASIETATQAIKAGTLKVPFDSSKPVSD